MQIKLKHLAPYLPYGLQFICICPESMEYEISCATNIHLGNEIIEVGATEFEFSDLGGKELKPILRPLSDLTKEIEHNGEKFVPIEVLELDSCDLSTNKYSGHIEIRPLESNEWIYAIDAYTEIIDKLFEWHFDVFGLIEKGLAIDINTINS